MNAAGRLLGSIMCLIGADARACEVLLDCPMKMHAEAQTELARIARTAIKTSMTVEEVKGILGRPNAVTLPSDKDPDSGDFELMFPEEDAVLWYANGRCGPVAVQFQTSDGKQEATVAGAALACVVEPAKTFPFNPPSSQRCDGGRKRHAYCR